MSSFLTQEFFSSIDDFRSIHITPNHAEQKKVTWNVHLDRSNGCPEVKISLHLYQIFFNPFARRFKFTCIMHIYHIPFFQQGANFGKF